LVLSSDSPTSSLCAASVLVLVAADLQSRQEKTFPIFEKFDLNHNFEAGALAGPPVKTAGAWSLGDLEFKGP